jgi:hypothetical protein
MLAFLGYGSLLFSRPTRLFTLLNRAVFAVYIIHLPVQQAVAFFLFHLDLNAWLAFALHLVATLSISGLIYTFVLRPMHWLHPFVGIAPVKPEPSRVSSAAETPPSHGPWPVTWGRFATLYVVSPLVVFVTAVGLVVSAVFLDTEDTTQTRFQRELASRSYEENLAVAEGLIVPLEEMMEVGNAGRAKDLSLEITMIMQALENQSEANADQSRQEKREGKEAGPGGKRPVERLHREIASRSREENRAVAQGLIVALKTALQAGNAGRARDLSREIQMILEALEN